MSTKGNTRNGGTGAKSKSLIVSNLLRYGQLLVWSLRCLLYRRNALPTALHGFYLK